MSKAIEALLAECEDLLARHEVNRAYDNLLEVIRNGSKQDLLRLEVGLAEIIARFLPKRKRDLTLALQRRMFGAGDESGAVAARSKTTLPERITDSLDAFKQDVGDRLDLLSRYHIFQWSTYYRDELRAILANTVALIRAHESADEAFQVLRTESERHAREIFTKGYTFVSTQAWMTAEQAEGKSLAGLRSFLELPVELYADESARLSTPQDCRVLRRATSRILCGVLQGFATSSLGAASPPVLLQRTIKSWARVLPLLEEQDLTELDRQLHFASLSPILGGPLRVLARALDEASRMSSVDPMVIQSASISLDDRVMDLALRPPADSSDTKPLELAILAGDAQVVRHQVEQRAKLGYIACEVPIEFRLPAGRSYAAMDC